MKRSFSFQFGSGVDFRSGFRIGLLSFSFCLFSMVQDCAAQYSPYPAPDDPNAPYSALQLLDGFGAILVAVGEPIFYPIDQANECKDSSGSSAKAGGCAFVGLLVSPFLVARDALLGVGDIVTGGYFKLARHAGVFDYFVDDSLTTTN